MSYKLSELRRKTEDELIDEHDRFAESTVVGINYYLDELSRRESAKQTETILGLTHTIARLTWVIAGLTAANVILVAWEVLR